MTKEAAGITLVRMQGKWVLKARWPESPQALCICSPFYAGHQFGVERGREIAWQEAASAIKKMLDEVKSEIAAKEMQS